MEKTESYSLSIEELVLSLQLIGYSEMGAGLLSLVYDEFTEEELKIKMRTAGHSLMAKGLLTIDMEKETKSLDENFSNALSLLGETDYSIRFGKLAAEEEVLMFHFKGHTIVQQSDEQGGLVHIIDVIPAYLEVADAGFKFYEIEQVYETDPTLQGNISSKFINEVGEYTQLPLAEIEKILLKDGLSKSFSSLLAQDLKQIKAFSSIIKVIYQEEGPEEEDGFILLQGHKRNWIIKPASQSSYLVLPGTRENFLKEFENLVR